MKNISSKKTIIKCIYDYDNSKCQALEYTGNNIEQIIKFIGDTNNEVTQNNVIQYTSLSVIPGQMVVKDLDHNDWYAYRLPVFNKYFKPYE